MLGLRVFKFPTDRCSVVVFVLMVTVYGASFVHGTLDTTSDNNTELVRQKNFSHTSPLTVHELCEDLCTCMPHDAYEDQDITTIICEKYNVTSHVPFLADPDRLSRVEKLYVSPLTCICCVFPYIQCRKSRIICRHRYAMGVLKTALKHGPVMRD